ncbi:hypothetical protein BDQ12DRAFT_663378 [Crucibulum laeve]|uniref:Uncharacterized protein n=1 Tax=Crucibulum laeve TaxID=68775 RepID=A0A5C3M9P6_9AGAR|nr:hypothetical protein BDQ12DRAFT_663378 [Crucibulum laeve]
MTALMLRLTWGYGDANVDVDERNLVIADEASFPFRVDRTIFRSYTTMTKAGGCALSSRLHRSSRMEILHQADAGFQDYNVLLWRRYTINGQQNLGLVDHAFWLNAVVINGKLMILPSGLTSHISKIRKGLPKYAIVQNVQALSLRWVLGWRLAVRLLKIFKVYTRLHHSLMALMGLRLTFGLPEVAKNLS